MEGLTEILRELRELATTAPPSLAGRVASALELGDRYVTVEGPAGVGPLRVAFNPAGISFVYATDDDDLFRQAFARRLGPSRPLQPASSPPPKLVAALRARRGDTLRYDLSALSPFQRAVLAKTAQIPPGEVRSYGWVASQIGQAGAVRAVGTALGNNPIPLLIPCHRVVRADGVIGSYSMGGPSVKQRLLADEGIAVDQRSRRVIAPAMFSTA